MSYTVAQMRSLVATCIGRRDDYALQRPDGLYTRVGRPLTWEVLRWHLEGKLTIASYVIDEHGLSHTVMFDADSTLGLVQLLDLQTRLASEGVISYLEGSRRGGHLRVFLSSPVAPAVVRRWLLPSCPAGVEFYPKQDTASSEHPGSLVRVPLGVHRLSGRRYPFVQVQGGKLVPLARSVGDALSWLSMVERASVPDVLPSRVAEPAPTTTKKNILQKKVSTLPSEQGWTIGDWCQEQDALEVIGRYVELDSRGMGCCPFGWHHADGRDSRPSLWVYRPSGGDLCCWYCYVWQRGGSVFDFLRFYYSVDARTLWQRIRSGEQF